MKIEVVAVKRNLPFARVACARPEDFQSAFCLPPSAFRNGFTLLELLVAIAIFAVVAALAYGGLASVLKAREETTAAAERLRALQQTLLIVQRDVGQVVQRGIRDEHGDGKPALHGGQDWVEFTRGGWSNPTGQVRSELQRVAYTLRDTNLVRAHWLVLDRAQDSRPVEAPLLPKTRNLRLRYLDAGGAWHDSWPPSASGGEIQQDPPLPRALEFSIELESWGKIVRLLQVR